MDAEWWTAFGTILLAAVTFLLAVVAIFQDIIHSWIRRPRLEIAVATKPPDCHKTEVVGRTSGSGQVRAPVYYLRFRVRNSGNLRAESVEIFAAELSRRKADGSFERVESFLPMNLVWSHVRQPFLGAISPGMEKSCDLAHIIRPQERKFFSTEDDARFNPTENVLSLDLEVQPFTLTHLLPKGTYRLRLLIGAANTKPVQRTLEIVHHGTWFDDEEKMLSDGIGLSLV